MQHMSKESQRVARYRTRMETVDKWMAKRHLPLKLRSRIGHYYAEVRSCHSINHPHNPVPRVRITAVL